LKEGHPRNSESLLNFTRFPLLSLCRVPNLNRRKDMSELSTKPRMSCPRCRAAMDEVVRIEPTLGEKGLIAFECPKCVYVTSVLLEPQTRKGSRRRPALVR
jgi:hypothetical protein